MNILRLFLISCVLALGGCDLTPGKKKAQTEPSPTVKLVQDMELAKIILKPERQPSVITRDPFKPLLAKTELLNEAKTDDNTRRADEEDLKKIKFLGLIKLGENYSVFLQSETKKGVYKVNDEFEHFTIINIQPEFVELKRGNNSYKLKRGEK